jgi:hypothetical protein
MRNVLPDWAVGCSSARCCCRRCSPRSTAGSAPSRRHLPVGRWAGWIAAAAVAAAARLGVGCAWLGLGVLSVPAGAVGARHLPARDGRDRRVASTASSPRWLGSGVRPLIVGDSPRAGARPPAGWPRHRPRRQRGRRGRLAVQPVARPALLLPLAHLGCWPPRPGSRLRARGRRLPSRSGVALPLLALAHYVTRWTSTRCRSRGCWALITANGHISVAAAGRGLALARLPRRAAWWSARAPPGRGDGRARAPAHSAARPATPGPGSLGGTESALRR